MIEEIGGVVRSSEDVGSVWVGMVSTSSNNSRLRKGSKDNR